MTHSAPGTTGTPDTRLIVLRGNSTSGKSSVASGLREKFGRNLAIVAQDNPRSFEETVLRHTTKPDAEYLAHVNEGHLRDWYREKDLLPDGLETAIDAASTLDETVQQILSESGLDGIFPGWAPEPGQPDLTQVIREVLGRPAGPSPLVPPRRRLTFLFDDETRFQNSTLPRRYT